MFSVEPRHNPLLSINPNPPTNAHYISLLHRMKDLLDYAGFNTSSQNPVLYIQAMELYKHNYITFAQMNHTIAFDFALLTTPELAEVHLDIVANRFQPPRLLEEQDFF
jgi:hypothetical protein